MAESYSGGQKSSFYGILNLGTSIVVVVVVIVIIIIIIIITIWTHCSFKIAVK
jgi:hypothetical protein